MHLGGTLRWFARSGLGALLRTFRNLSGLSSLSLEERRFSDNGAPGRASLCLASFVHASLLDPAVDCRLCSPSSGHHDKCHVLVGSLFPRTPRLVHTQRVEILHHVVLGALEEMRRLSDSLASFLLICSTLMYPVPDVPPRSLVLLGEVGGQWVNFYRSGRRGRRRSLGGRGPFRCFGAIGIEIQISLRSCVGNGDVNNILRAEYNMLEAGGN